MSGHSKWASIKHKKGAVDAKRGKMFTKLIKELTVAARMGGDDQNFNPRLRTAIAAAKAANMPKDNIDRAIKKGAGDTEGFHYEEAVYEGYGPAGVALIVEVLTDNRNRTVADIRYILSRNSGRLGETGSVSYLFDKRGIISVEKSGVDEDTLMGAALDAGAMDVKDEESTFDVITEPSDFEAVRDAIEKGGFSIAEASVTMLPKNSVAVTGKDAERMLRLMDALEDNEDVQNVYANFDISEEVMEELNINGIIVGIDPGITVTGYGVIRGGQTLQVVSKGEIRPRADLSLAQRLDAIFSGIQDVLMECRPEAVAVEGLFHAKNVSSALTLAHARGVVFLAAARCDIPVFEYSPREVKSAVTGYGAAEKGQVESMIRVILCVEGKVSSHACDALAVALCHHHGARFRRLQGMV